MRPERYEEVCRAFKEAAALEGEARVRYLESLEGRDAELRGEVEEMLGFDERQADSFDDDSLRQEHEALERLISDAATAGDTRTRGERPEAVGPYRVLDILGQGGMGTVFLCEQLEPIQRRVAVKLIKLGMDSERILQRFAIEREALQRMQHPGIAQLLDAGVSADGRPFFAMENVDGAALLEYCDAHGLDLRARLELFATCLRGLHHAHQRGILHRDLKPSNLLVTQVDGEHLPKIIDFGLARAVSARGDASFATRPGEILGTPAYMSPEQLHDRGDVDVRSDVFSMGAVLYELLSGRPAYDVDVDSPGTDLLLLRARGDSRTPAPSSRVAAQDDESRSLAAARASDPRALSRSLRGELDWIVLRAMELDKDRRYASAAEFADDLRAYLEGRPLLAGPPELSYRLAKFVRRNRVVVVASGLVVVSLFSGTVAALLSAKEARAAELVALQAEEDMAQLLEDAKAQNDILYRTFTRPDPRFGGRETKVVDLLPYAVEYAEERYPDRPSVLTGVLGSLGGTYRELGMYEEAERLLRLALEYQVDADPEDHAALAFKMNGLAILLKRMGRFAEAEELYRAAIAEHMKIEGEVDGSSLGGWQYNLGKLLLERGAIEEGEAVLLESLETHRREMPEDRIGPGLIQLALGGIAAHRGEQVAAEEAFRAALASLERAESPPVHVVQSARCRLGELLSVQGRGEEAEALLVASVRAAREALGVDNPSLWIYMRPLAEHYIREGDAAGAEELVLDMLRLAREQLDPLGLPSAQVREVHGDLLILQGRTEEAIAVLQEVLAVFEAQLPEDDLRLLALLETLDGL